MLEAGKEEAIMQVKNGDRFKLNDIHGGVRFGTVQGDLDDTNPCWPTVPVLLDGPNEKSFLADITLVELVQPLWGQDQSHKNGIAAIIGKWPGDETDDQIHQALNELS